MTASRPTGLPLIPQRHEVDVWGTRFIVVAVRGELRVRVSMPLDKDEALALAERLNVRHRELNVR